MLVFARRLGQGTAPGGIGRSTIGEAAIPSRLTIALAFVFALALALSLSPPALAQGQAPQAPLAQAPLAQAPLAQAPLAFEDNAASIGIVIGNRGYKQTVTVDYAHNDAEAIRDYLVRSLGFREQNVLLLKDATLSELNQALGTEGNPQGGRLWRNAVEGRSNVFVYYSGHGVPDLATRQPFLLPSDGDPNRGESGYSLETLYRNLDLVKGKVGADRQVVVMVDACFTGETGRKGEGLLAVSAPGFAPARPKASAGVVKLVATSGASPANWDDEAKLGLFTARFLMGVSGAAGPAKAAGAAAGPRVGWSELRAYVVGEVEGEARRRSGREQVPEIDAANLSLRVGPPVKAIQGSLGRGRDEAAWREADRAGTREALERYVGRCGEPCGHREEAMGRLLELRRPAQADLDEENWRRLGAAGRYQDYLDGCGAVCAYRALAEAYLGPRRTAAAPPPAEPVSPRQGASPLGEPRRVRTTAVLVRPDGTPIVAAPADPPIHPTPPSGLRPEGVPDVGPAPQRQGESPFGEPRRVRTTDLRADGTPRTSAPADPPRTAVLAPASRPVPPAPPVPRREAPAQNSYAYIVGLDPAGDNWLALRSEPGGRGVRLMKMGPDTPLTILDRDGAWSRVRLLSGETGWAASRFLACCRPEPLNWSGTRF